MAQLVSENKKDGWMDGWMMAREEDGGGRRKRVEARLDDASRLFGRVSQIGQVVQSPTEDASIQISVNWRSAVVYTHEVSLRFWSPSLYSVHGRRNRALKRSTAVPIAMLKLILPRSALMNAESGEGTTSMSNQSRSVYIRKSFDNTPLFTRTYPGVCGCHKVYV